MKVKENSISVVIPMYNSEKHIERTLNCIINQTAKQYLKEVIVVNDGSKDNCPALVEKIASNSDVLIRLVNKPNGGVSTARNRGMQEATGDWIAFCDSDDHWTSDKIEVQVKILNENDIDFLGCNHLPYPMKILFKTIDSLHKGTVKEILIKNFPQASTVVMKRSIYEEIGGFDETQRYAEDGNYFLHIAHDYKFYYSPEIVADYGDGKRGFGVSGLSGNLKGMHLGNVKNLKECLQKKWISYPFYLSMRVFFFIKYLRRIVITKLTKK